MLENYQCKNYQFNYIFSGNTSKPLILLLHGFMGDVHEFNEVISMLADDFCCLEVDLPGHGKTQILSTDSKYECYQMPNTANALIQLLDKLLDKLNVSECFLIGYSMGGRLALYLALHFPQYFTKVILESTSPGLATESERLARIQGDAQIARKISRIITREDFTIFLANWYSQTIFGEIKNHPQFSQLIEQRLQNNPEQLVRSLKMMGTGVQPSLWSKLATNKIPLLLLVGELDTKFREIQQCTKYSQLRTIENTAHNIHFEKPLEFVKAAKNFLITDSGSGYYS